MRKIFDQCFYFLPQIKLGKSAFFECSGEGDLPNIHAIIVKKMLTCFYKN